MTNLKKWFGRFAATALALTLAVGAHAAWNIRQNQNGTTDWVPTSNSFGTERVGRVRLTMPLANIVNSTTFFIVSPVTGKLVEFSVILNNTITQSVTFQAWLSGVTGSHYIATAPTGTLAASAATGTAVTVRNPFLRTADGSTSFDSTWTVTGYTDNPLVKQYRPIAIRVGNPPPAGGSLVDGVVTITIDQE